MTRIIDDVKLDYDDVLLVPQLTDVSSRADVNLEGHTFGVRGIPLIAANMDGVGTFDMARELAKHRCFTALVKHYSVEDLVRFFTETANADIIPYTIYSMGTNPADLAKFNEVLELIQTQTDNLDAQSEPRLVCVDVANGYQDSLLDFVAEFKEENPYRTLIVGNVATPAGVHRLIRAGADFVKVGIGPGSVCTTRIVTGVGYPQFSAVLECSQAALEAGGYVIADGGCKNPGDVAKALGAGASAVMLGGMLAGHFEGGKVKNHTDKVEFYGMASKTAQLNHNGGVKDYRSSEGREVAIQSRGHVFHTIQHILGGLRSACAYTNCSDIIELPARACFAKVNRQYNKVFE